MSQNAEQGVENNAEDQANRQAPDDKNDQPESGSQEPSVDDNDSNQQDSGEDVDYKAEFERLSDKYTQYKDRTKEDIKRLKKKAEKVEDYEDDNEGESLDINSIKSELLEQLREELNEKTQSIQEQASSNVIRSEIKKLASNEDEAKLIDLHYDKSIQKTGDIEEDIQNAWFLANKTKILKQNEELRNVLDGRSSQSFGGGNASSGRKPSAPSLSDKEKRMLDKFGALDDVNSGKIKI